MLNKVSRCESAVLVGEDSCLNRLVGNLFWEDKIVSGKTKTRVTQYGKIKKEENTEFWDDVEVTVKGGFLLALL